MFLKPSDTPNFSTVRSIHHLTMDSPAVSFRVSPGVSFGVSPGIYPIRPARTSGLLVSEFNYYAAIHNSSHLTNATRPIQSSTAANATLLRQTCSLGRSSASQSGSMGFLSLSYLRAVEPNLPPTYPLHVRPPHTPHIHQKAAQNPIITQLPPNVRRPRHNCKNPIRQTAAGRLTQ